ncbi:MAG: hypothetical protein J0H66_08920 [Solirubrobacterales bacterium]|nr:hypothetical protein [Solirubrobacterales bacterium]OJU95803.1 MAG: hypothetical protein BGO23_09465 [Solirubrobacterales bacterium 67-14]
MSKHKHGKPHPGSEDGDPEVPDYVGFKKGEKVWVHTENGQRPAVYVGDGENATFFGGPPLAYVVMEDTDEGGEVELDRITARN